MKNLQEKAIEDFIFQRGRSLPNSISRIMIKKIIEEFLKHSALKMGFLNFRDDLINCPYNTDVLLLEDLEDGDPPIIIKGCRTPDNKFHYFPYSDTHRYAAPIPTHIMGWAHMPNYELLSKEQFTVPPTQGGCWICYGIGGTDWIFDSDFDAFVHRDCLFHHQVNNIHEYEEKRREND